MNSDLSLPKWFLANRFVHFVKLNAGNLNMLLYTGKLLAIAIVQENDSNNKLPADHEAFRDMVEEISSTYNDSRNQFLFCWTTHSDIISSIAMSMISLPGFIAINSTNLEYYLVLEDTINTESIVKLLDGLRDNPESQISYGGDRYHHRLLRMAYDGWSSLGAMYRGNPLLTLLMFGLPLAFLSIIIYTSCCSDILDGKDGEDLDDTEDEDTDILGPVDGDEPEMLDENEYQDENTDQLVHPKSE